MPFSLFDEVIPIIKASLEDAMKNNIYDINQLQKVVRRTTGKWVSDEVKWLKLLIYYLIASVIITFVLAIVRDMAVLRDIKSGLKKSGMI